MSKKNNFAKRRNQHNFDLQREKEAKEKRLKKLQAKHSKMKIYVGISRERGHGLLEIDGSDKQSKRKSGGFQVRKRKLKTKLSALTKATAAQAMQVDE